MHAVKLTSTSTRRQHCPNCGADNWLRDQTPVDGIRLYTQPPSMPGNLGCNRCGHSWTPSA